MRGVRGVRGVRDVSTRNDYYNRKLGGKTDENTYRPVQLHIPAQELIKPIRTLDILHRITLEAISAELNNAPIHHRGPKSAFSYTDQEKRHR